jgi:hypothetical protein
LTTTLIPKIDHPLTKTRKNGDDSVTTLHEELSKIELEDWVHVEKKDADPLTESAVDKDTIMPG